MSQSFSKKSLKLEIKESGAEESASAFALATGSQSHFREFMNSFKRDGAAMISTDLEYDKLTEEDKVQWYLATKPNRKVIDRRQLTMISIGGTLRTGLFVGIGLSLASDPDLLLIAFMLVGMSMFASSQL